MGEPDEKEVQEFMEEANDNSPVPEEDKKSSSIDPAYQNEDGTLTDRPIMKPTDGKKHPIGSALKRAKAEIANILKDEDNLQHLRNVLEVEFEKDPIGFLERFAPLLEKYENILVDAKNAEEKGAAVRIVMNQGPESNQTAVEVRE